MSERVVNVEWYGLRMELQINKDGSRVAVEHASRSNDCTPIVWLQQTFVRGHPVYHGKGPTLRTTPVGWELTRSGGDIQPLIRGDHNVDSALRELLDEALRQANQWYAEHLPKQTDLSDAVERLGHRTVHSSDSEESTK